MVNVFHRIVSNEMIKRNKYGELSLIDLDYIFIQDNHPAVLFFHFNTFEIHDGSIFKSLLASTIDQYSLIIFQLISILHTFIAI